MPGTRRPEATSDWLRPLLAALLVFGAEAARAQAPACDEGGDPCACNDAASCLDFAFLSSGDTTLLGTKLMLSSLDARAGRRRGAGVLVAYSADAFRTHGLLSNHVAVFGAIGGGSAGTEGQLGGGIDFGARLPIDPLHGAVARIGPSGLWLGHDHVELSLLDPLRLSLAFQRLDESALFESGLIGGVLYAGKLRVLHEATSLSGALELGYYATARLRRIRLLAEVSYVEPEEGPGFAMLHVEGCAHPRPIALCADLRYVEAVYPSARLIYGGLTLGLTP